MPVVETTLVDTDLVYATVEDVESFFENQTFDANSTPTKTTVEQKIADKSDWIDEHVRRAWRTRKVEDLTLEPKFSYKQESPRHRRRSIRGQRGRQHYNMDMRGRVQLPHLHVKQFDSNKGDKVEVLNPRDVEDVTDKEGRANGKYIVNYRRGVLRPDLDLFQIGATATSRGRIPEDVQVRVTYRFGRTSTDSDNDDVPDNVPGAVREACAKLVAADLMDSDQYADLVPGGGGGVPIEAAAKNHQREAKDMLKDYRRDGV